MKKNTTVNANYDDEVQYDKVSTCKMLPKDTPVLFNALLVEVKVLMKWLI